MMEDSTILHLKKIIIAIQMVYIILLLFCGCSIEQPLLPKRQLSCDTQEIVNSIESNQIIIDIDYSNIKVFFTKDDLIKIEEKKIVKGCFEDSDLESELEKFISKVKTENNTLKYECRYKGKIKTPTDKRNYINVYINKDIHKLHIKLKTGKIDVYDTYEGCIKIEAQNSNININKIIGLLEVKNELGDININNGHLYTNSTLESENGNINVACKIDNNGEYSFKTIIGNIFLSFPSYTKCYINSDSKIIKNELIEDIEGVKLNLFNKMGQIKILKYSNK